MEVGHLPTLDVMMQVGTSTETVEVSAQATSDRRDAEQGADQYFRYRSCKTAYADPFVPERDSVRSREPRIRNRCRA